MNETLSDGATPLWLAVENNNLEAFEKLLALGADCRLAKKNGANLAHVAAENNFVYFLERIKKVAPELLNLPIDNLTPLCLAIEKNNEEAFNFFMTSGIDFTHCSLAPYFAVQYKRLSFLRSLGELGVNLHLNENHESSLLFLAIQYQSLACLKYLLEQDLISK